MGPTRRSKKSSKTSSRRKSSKNGEVIIHQDLSMGRSTVPVPCYSAKASDRPPKFQYISDYLINQRGIPAYGGPDGAIGCKCKGDCSRKTCACVQASNGLAYETHDRKIKLVPREHDPNKLVSPRSWNDAIFECHDLCKCHVEECCNRVSQNRTDKVPLEVFKTERYGWGIRTPVALDAGTYIGDYIGEYIKQDEYQNRSGRYFFQLGRNSKYTIDAELFGNEMRFINHSCDPNCFQALVVTNRHGFLPKVSLFTIRDVEPGEELTIHYGDWYWVQMFQQSGSFCKCGAETCRVSRRELVILLESWLETKKTKETVKTRKTRQSAQPARAKGRGRTAGSRTRRPASNSSADIKRSNSRRGDPDVVDSRLYAEEIN